MKHTRYNGGMIRPRGDKWLAEINRDYHQKRKVCASEGEARAWIDAEQLISRREIPQPDARDLIDATDARKILPGGVSLLDAARYFVEHRRANPLATATVTDLYNRYLAEKTAAGLRARSLGDIRSNIGRMSVRFGATPISELSPALLIDYLNSLKAAPVTRNNLRRYWFGFFDFCRRLGAIADNPAGAIAVSRVDAAMPGILTPAQAKALLQAAKRVRADLIHYLAIGLFTGMRSSELLFLDYQDISPTHIRVTPSIAKKRRQRLIPIPDNVRAIVKRRANGPVCPVRKRRLYFWLKKICKEAGIAAWPKNAMRHSFASYHIARYRDAAKTALILGHSQSSSVLWDNYRELVTDSDARKYFAIRV